MAVELPEPRHQDAVRALGSAEHPPRPSDRGAHESRGGLGRRPRGPAAVGLQRRRRRRRGHRLGHHRTGTTTSPTRDVEPKVRVVDGQRVTAFVDFVNNRPRAVRRQRPRDARRGHHRRQRLRLVRRARRHRAGGAPGQPEGARRQRPRRHQRRHRRVRVGGRQPRGAQHPRHQPLGRRARHRVVQDRPADARGQARRRRRHRRRHRGRQPRARTANGADAVRRHHGAGQRALGADRRRVQHRGHASRGGTTRWRGYSSRGPSAVDFEAKPDLVAPGTGIVSLADPASEFYRPKAALPAQGHAARRPTSRI